MDDDTVRRIAKAKTTQLHRDDAPAAVRDIAANLLADLYLVGLRYGVDPAVWAAVTALPTACLDATLASARQSARARRSPEAARRTSPDPDRRGRE